MKHICYDYSNEKSILHWYGQWNKPLKFQAVFALFIGIILFILGITIFISKQYKQIQFIPIRQI